METIRENFRIIMVGLIALILICVVGIILYSVFFYNPEAVSNILSAPTLSSTGGTLTLPPAVTEEPTSTPTHVIQEQPTTEEPTSETAITPTSTPTPASIIAATSTRAAVSATKVPVSTTPRPGPIDNLLKNGDFEQGFGNGGVALAWEPFKNDGVQVIYGQETFPYVESGSNAQRVTMIGASDFNRYAGIYQQVEVLPNQTYTLTLHGQIRTGLGDVSKSSYGYRIQYATTHLKNWQNIPEADWVELPWDEQLLNASITKFYNYTTTLQSSSDKLNVFVRAWNKWPDPGEAQYTFDSFRLVGPTVISETLTPATDSGEPMINKPLPVTGIGDDSNLMRDGRFWIGLLLLSLLTLGAVSRAKWGYK